MSESGMKWIYVYWGFSILTLIFLGIAAWMLLAEKENPCGNESSCEGYDNYIAVMKDVPTYQMEPDKPAIRCIDNLNRYMFIIFSNASYLESTTTTVDISYIQDGMAVGYESKSALEVFKVICSCLDHDVSGITFIEHNAEAFKKEKFVVPSPQHSELHAYFMLFPFNDKAMFLDMFGKVPVQLVAYDRINKSKFHFFYPTATLEPFNIGSFLPTQSNQFELTKLFMFDQVLYGDELMGYDVGCTTPESKRAEYLRFPSHFSLQNEQSIEAFTPKTESNKQSPYISIQPQHSIDGVLKMNKHDVYKMFETSSIIDGVEVRVGDRISLSFQEDESENGQYVVMQKRNNNIYMFTAYPLRSTDLHFAKEQDHIIAKFNNTHVPDYVIQHDRIYVHDEDLYGYIRTPIRLEDKTKSQTFEAVVMNMKNADFQWLYRCVTDPKLVTEEACTSNKDITNSIVEPGVWDRPCVKNTDCPFYRANKYYYNSRGGCANGFCEMPVGVQRQGYRQYKIDDSSYPYCHGCPYSDMKACCSNQEPKDIAFAFDLEDRFKDNVKGSRR